MWGTVRGDESLESTTRGRHRACDRGRTGRCTRSYRKAAVGAGLAALSLLCAAATAADNTLVLLYNERPPYNISALNGEVRGLVATPLTDALRAQGIPHRWENTPLARQFKLIELGVGQACMVGLYRTAARAQYGKFSAPIYRDRRIVGIARAELGLRSGVQARTLMDDPRMRLMLKSGLTYGAELAGLIRAHKPRTETVTVETYQMVQMLRADRADWMLVSEEEAGHLIAQASLGPDEVTVLHFPDLGEGETRHLLCTRQVPDALLRQIDAALPSVGSARGGSR